MRPNWWLAASGYRRRDSSTVQAKAWGAGRSARASSAAQKRLSNEALCATMGASPTKRAASRITDSAGGAVSSMAGVMPVSWMMKGGSQAPVLMRLWNRSTGRPSSMSTMATSVARAPCEGVMPVVSKSMTAIRDGMGRLSPFPLPDQAGAVSPPRGHRPRWRGRRHPGATAPGCCCPRAHRGRAGSAACAGPLVALRGFLVTLLVVVVLDLARAGLLLVGHACLLQRLGPDRPYQDSDSSLCSPMFGGLPVTAALAILKSWVILLSFTSQYSACWMRITSSARLGSSMPWGTRPWPGATTAPPCGPCPR